MMTTAVTNQEVLAGGVPVEVVVPRIGPVAVIAAEDPLLPGDLPEMIVEEMITTIATALVLPLLLGLVRI